jgi:hypothetical protein
MNCPIISDIYLPALFLTIARVGRFTPSITIELYSWKLMFGSVANISDSGLSPNTSLSIGSIFFNLSKSMYVAVRWLSALLV